MSRVARGWPLGAGAVGALCLLGAPAPAAPKVEVEEVVATCPSPDNGAGPLWCYGAPLVV